MNESRTRIASDPQNTVLSGPEIVERWRRSADLVRRHIAAGRIAALHIAPGIWELERPDPELA